jgi:hypothetical protein
MNMQYKTRALYYKTLRIHNLQKIDTFHDKLTSLQLLVTNTLAYYDICTFRIRNVFIVQGPDGGISTGYSKIIVSHCLDVLAILDVIRQ